MNEIIDANTGEIKQSGVEYTTNALILDPSMEYGEWEEVGERLKIIEGAIQWYIGDWLNFGERSYGEMYAQAVDETQKNNWANYKWVSSRFEISRRRENPISFAHHQEVAPMSIENQDYWFDRIKKDGLSRNDLRHAIRRWKFEETIKTLPDGKYRVIYADPPWEYGMAQHSRDEQETVLETHYPTMPLQDICDFPIGNITGEDAVLFMWATSPLLPQAFDVIDAWGFEYKAAFIWDKVKHNVGYYNSVRHEFLLIGTRGSCLPDKKPDGVPILIDSVQTIERTEHSRKPEEFRQIIDNLYPEGKRIELFARSEHDGWEAWGNEDV